MTCTTVISRIRYDTATIRYDAPMAIRSESSRKAVLDAALQLLGDKPPGPLTLQKLSIEGIARQAGVSKMTIYRWWANKAELVIEAFLENHIAQTPIATEGRAVEALRAHAAALTKVYAGPEGKLVAQLIAECQYDAVTLETFKGQFWRGRTEAVNALIKRAQAEGDIRADLDPDHVAEIIYGPIYFRLLFQTSDLDADTTGHLIDAVLHGISA
ncbi:TetR/AcrR family transcriptional regulator [Nocardioides sp. NBC_00368]|uniref:TetR/AcrR family transcriptional regulator n=1 Tax=Nocardioides sp. NBC_00368 TaxID=2976000 RepID=UPI002E2295A5